MINMFIPHASGTLLYENSSNSDSYAEFFIEDGLYFNKKRQDVRINNVLCLKGKHNVYIGYTYISIIMTTQTLLTTN